jgi:SAM-dependent methyltransferase
MTSDQPSTVSSDEKTPATSAYPLGYSDSEQERLYQQAAFLDDLTTDVLRAAGVTTGMRVLDLGCGTGNVTMAAARLVGQTGQVTGVDRNGSSFPAMREQLRREGVENVEFIKGELPDGVPQGPFDAVVGRLILLYFPDRAATVRKFARLVRPGGIIAFHEPILSSARSIPPLPSMTAAVSWMCAAFRAMGIDPDPGAGLDRAFRHAGLQPMMVGGIRMDGHGDGFCPTWLAMTIRSLAPVILGNGIAFERDIDFHTLEAKVRAEALNEQALILGPTMIGTWARIPDIAL